MPPPPAGLDTRISLPHSRKAQNRTVLFRRARERRSAIADTFGLRRDGVRIDDRIWRRLGNRTAGAGARASGGTNAGYARVLG